jgi:RnfABCDGE-type electron transport complex G subunit
MIGLVTSASKFEPVIKDTQLNTKSGKQVPTSIYMAMDSNRNTTGFVFVAEGPGFADKIKLVIAADKDFSQFLGFKVLYSNETPGFGSRITEPFFSEQFVHIPAEKLDVIKSSDPEMAKVPDDEIVAITGATVSSEAVVKIFNDYVNAIKEQLVSKGLIK